MKNFISDSYFVKRGINHPVEISKFDINDNEIFQTSISVYDCDIAPTSDGGFCFLNGFSDIYKYDNNGDAEIIIELEDCNNDSSLCIDDYFGSSIYIELFSPIKRLDGGRYHYNIAFYDWFFGYTELVDVFLDGRTKSTPYLLVGVVYLVHLDNL